MRYWRTALVQERLDLFEDFHLPLVRAPNCPNLLTLHDMRPLLLDRFNPERLLYTVILHRALAKADRVIAVSNTVKNEILAFHPDAPVTTIYNGVDTHAFHKVADFDPRPLRRKYSLPEQFVLAVGHLENRKNYRKLIEAIGLLEARARPTRLVIVGNDGGSKCYMEKDIRRFQLNGSVMILSNVADTELLGIYQLCSLVVFPSLYEGFGIPILEAMAARRPIVLSDVPVFREITEDTGVYFPPLDAERIATALDQVISSSEERARLVRYGDERVKAFTFSVLAAQHAQVYRSLSTQSS
jgi:glycosyltransferase involved in cell wall biosynthesis